MITSNVMEFRGKKILLAQFQAARTSGWNIISEQNPERHIPPESPYYIRIGDSCS